MKRPVSSSPPASPPPGAAQASPLAAQPSPKHRSFLLALAVLVVVLAALFSRSFEPSQVLFSSDGPLGANMASYARVPEGYTGMWQDIYWVGKRSGSAFPSVTYALLWLLQPLYFAKFYAPLSLLLLGLSVWLFFRQLGFRPMVCVLGSLAAALNTDLLSYACWGLGTTPLAAAAIFLGLAALATPATNNRWIKAVLAGLAVGLAVMEGFDTGAIFSLYFAAYVLFVDLGEPGPAGRRWIQGLLRVVVVALAAAYMATQALTVLIGTQIQGVVGMQQDTRTKTQRWDEATQWSLPKAETLRVFIPGLFGYRMDTGEGGRYWGGVGQTPGYVQTRHSGAGVYGGACVVVVALWALLQSFRKQGKLLTPAERRLVWFWGGALLISLVLAWGRHAPFYHLVYALPYFSTIRNPIKYMHPFSLCLVVLFGYGLQCLCRGYLDRALAAGSGFSAQLKGWWSSVAGFDRRWVLGLAGALGASVLGWMLYAASRTELERFLKVAVDPDPATAAAIAGHSLTEVGWFILFLALTAAVLVLILSGVLAGVRGRWAAVCLGMLLIADFSHANAPWVYYWNWEEKYATNPILDRLRTRPYEHRVAILPLRVNEQLAFLQNFYHVEWLQNPFPYYNIQSLDVPQEPRPTAENTAFRNAFLTNGLAGYMRMWHLTNTRFLFGLAGGFLDSINQQADPVLKRYQLHTAFTFEPAYAGGPLVARTNTAGPFALIEFQGVLPRAKLYTTWQVCTNDGVALTTLADLSFDATRTVLVADPLPAPALASTNAPAGTVEFLDYAPKRVRLLAKATAPSVLLLNDAWDRHWRVSVDGQPQSLLRCNYLMRGVHLTSGRHTLEFSFELPNTALWVSVAGIVTGLGLLGFGCLRKPKPLP